MRIKIISLLLLLSVFSNFISLNAQTTQPNKDRRHWKYVADMSDKSSGDELVNLKTTFWTGACYIGDGKAVTFTRGEKLYLFDYDKYSESDAPKNSNVWSLINPQYYELLNGVKVVSTSRPPDDLVGNSLAYIGDNKILLGPGRDDGAIIEETWIFDLADNSWTLMPNKTEAPIPTIYDYAMCHLVDDKVLAFGGKKRTVTNNITTDQLVNDTYIYDLSDNEWTEITSSSPPSARGSHSITSLGDGLAIMFGGLSSGALGDTWLFDYNDGAPIWTQLVFTSGPEPRYYALLQKLSTDIAILYGGCSSYKAGDKHYSDLWRFNYDRSTSPGTGTWTNISFSSTSGISSAKSDYLYYPAGYVDPANPAAPLPNNNYRNIDGESNNNTTTTGYGSGDHWGLYHGKRRATINAFLGNDRILLHGGGNYAYDGTNAYNSTNILHSKTYVFDLGIPDIKIDNVELSSETDAKVDLTIEKLNDDRGQGLAPNYTVTVTATYARTSGDDYSSVSITVDNITLSNTDNTLIEDVLLSNLPPNTEVEIVASFDLHEFGVNESDPVTITTGGGDRSLHLVGDSDYTIRNSANTLDLTNGFTISQWIKLEDNNSIFALEQNQGGSSLSATVKDNQISLDIGGTSCSSTNLDLSGNWYHVAFVFDPTTDKQRIYLDGYQVAEIANSSSITSNTDNIIFDITSSLNIDEFQIWATALTETQIKSMLYQPIYWSIGDEVHGSVESDKIDDLLWSDLKVYYKADYLDKAAPFSNTTKGCICQITGALGMSLENAVENSTTATDYIAEPDLPYINWKKDAADTDFYNEDNWFSGMAPEPDADPAVLGSYSFQAIVVNLNTNGIFPEFNENRFGELNALVIRSGAKLYVNSGDNNVTLPITRQLIYEDGGVIEISPNSLFVIGNDANVTVSN